MSKAVNTVTVKLATIHMDYPGRLISKNHLWHRGHRSAGMNRTALAWKDALAASVIALCREAGITAPAPPVTVRIGGRFRNRNHAPDMQNLVELIADSVQEGLGIDDKHFSIATEHPQFGAQVPEVLVTLEVTVEAK